MESKYNVVEVDRDSAISYLRVTGKSDAITPEMQTANGKVRIQVYQSCSQFSSIRSAIGCIYKSARVTQPEELSKELSLFINGMKRTISAAKCHLGLKISEGKDALWGKTLFLGKEK